MIRDGGEREPAIKAEDLGKTYNLRPVISHLSLEIESGEIVAVTGANGTGKSTLIKLLASLLEPTTGGVARFCCGKSVREHAFPLLTGLVAPYLSLYGEYTIRESVDLVSGLRGDISRTDRAYTIAEELGIAERFEDRVGALSSGMMQRVRFILALMHNPPFLFLDEPMSNLDSEGKSAISSLIRRRGADAVTVIATNDAEDLHLCTSELRID